MKFRIFFLTLFFAVFSVVAFAAKGPKIKRYSIGENYQIKALDFIDAKLGFAAGIRIVKTDSLDNGYYYVGVVLRSDNGGKKWNEVLAVNNVLFNALDVNSLGVGIVAGSFSGTPSEVSVFTSQNMGEAWTPSNSTLEHEHVGTNYKAVRIANNGDFYLVGAHIIRSKDTGVSWSRYDVSAKQKRMNRVEATAFTGEDDAFVLGLANLMHPALTLGKTDDKGQSWEFFEVIDGGQRHYVHDMQFPSNTVGFVLLGRNQLLRTQDGGQSWEELELKSNIQARKVHFINEKVGFIIGLKGSILRTTNGGKTWDSHLVDYDATFNAIDFIDHETGVIAGSAGNVYVLKF